MSSENEAVPAIATSDLPVISDAVPQPPSSEAPKTEVPPVESTSEANIAATDPDVPVPAAAAEEPKSDMAEADVDMKAADVAEGAESGAAVVAPGSSEDIGETPASSKKNNNQKRRSTGAVPEHKSKKLKGKKSMPTLRLDAQPGDYYFARLKGYPPWPAIICDEEMLPESLLGSRPVTAARPDGSYRDDFKEGGKNAKDRTYPVMFLYTNEFAWVPNVDLLELDVEKIKDEPQGKKGKKLFEAYQLASENHPLQYFKNLLAEWELELQNQQAIIEQEEAERQAKEDEKKAKKESKAKRKSKGADADEDAVDDSTVAPKSATKKRKKSTAVEESDETKPAKTPKTLKVNLSKPANGESSAKSKAKPVPKVATPQEPPMSEEEKLEKKQKSVLYLRHRLQKGFLQDSAPAESEMVTMAQHFDTLEQYQSLEAHVIKNTKIHKVLKAIMRLDSVPMDDEYKFKERSHKLLQSWNKILADGIESGASAAKDTDTSNGVGGDDKQNGDSVEESKVEENADDSKGAEGSPDETPAAAAEAKIEDAGESTVTPAEPLATGNDAKDEAEEGGDVSMTDAKDAPAPVDDKPANVVDATPAEPATSTTATATADGA